MSKKTTLIFLPVISVILLVLSFTYFIVFNIRQSNSSPYYKISGVQYNEITVITQKKQWTNLNLKNTTGLLAKKKVDQGFLGQSNNLGIIAIPFNTHNRSISDRIVFRIKQTGKNDWYFQSTYNADQFQNNIPFPFGFPILKNSKNISYTFEIESLNGTPNNSISISKANSYFFTKYKFSGAELVKNPYILSHFLLAKTSEQAGLLTVSEIVFIFFFLLLPFITYWVVVLWEKKNGLGLRKKILKKINRTFWYGQKTWRYLITSIKKITITHPLDRKTKINLCSLIIGVGFFFSVAFHYLQGLYFKQNFPLNSFIPNWFFGDFFIVFDQWVRFAFNGGSNYFPGTYLLIDLLAKLFTSPYIAVIVYLTFFTIFVFFYTYKNVKTDTILESLQNAFIISLMSYPFLFAFQTANLEIITFISVSLFFMFYTRNRLLSVIFLAYAISMKVFPGIFIVLLLLEKRYKDVLLTFVFTILFTLLPLIIFDGGFNKGIGSYIAHLKEGQQFYMDVMITGAPGFHYGHSLLNSLTVIFSNFIVTNIKEIMFPYAIFALVSFMAVVGYLIFFEKIFWRKLAVLVMVMNLLPFTSTDYKLLYIFLPLFFLINHSKKDKYDAIFIILFSLLLIPKNYFYFNNNPYASFTIVANTIIMLAILLLIIFFGITSNLRHAKNIFNNNKLLRKIIQTR